jgi:hypothetical protein
MANDLLDIPLSIDWAQVVSNGGPPCFHKENGRFCLRAERWEGHRITTGHHFFVSLKDWAWALKVEAVDDAHRKMLARLGGEDWQTAVPTSESYLSGKKAEDAVYNQAMFLYERGKVEASHNQNKTVPGQFYIQDSRSYVGNDALWWRPNGQGYTTNLNEAWRVDKERAESIARTRPTDKMWPCDRVDELAEAHLRFDSQKISKLEQSLTRS